MEQAGGAARSGTRQGGQSTTAFETTVGFELAAAGSGRLLNSQGQPAVLHHGEVHIAASHGYQQVKDRNKRLTIG
jgi:hypothetical protein